MAEETSVVTTQPERSDLKLSDLVLVGMDGHRGWTTGICDCGDDWGSCTTTYCCFTCMMCCLARRFGECPLMPCCVPFSIVAMRTKLRTMGGIKVCTITACLLALMMQGSICVDYLASVFCGCCAVCQIAREMNNMGI